MGKKLKKIIISVDGPAGSGKQRIAKHIAKKYSFFHLDSGILYRRLALIFIKKNFLLNNYNLNIFLNSITNISTRNHNCLRTEKISKISSKLATKQIVRIFINKQQRIIVEKKLKYYQGCVIDGRDIGSKVFKNAKIKLYIDAKVKIRAKRRHKQLIALGEKSIYAKILKEIKLRDKLDKKRKYSPLVVPKGAVIVNNSLDFKSTIKQLNNIFYKVS